MDAINQPLLDVRDLSVAFGATLAVDQSHSPSSAANAWRWSASPAPENPSVRCRS
jgi:hypothetical protein